MECGRCWFDIALVLAVKKGDPGWTKLLLDLRLMCTTLMPHFSSELSISQTLFVSCRLRLSPTISPLILSSFSTMEGHSILKPSST